MVQTAGDDRSVGEHGDLIFQGAAGAAVRAFLERQVRPVKFFGVVDEHAVPEPKAPCISDPRLGENGLEGF